MRHYCLGGCSVPSVCARRSRPVRGGFGPVPGVVSLLFPPSRPACSALRVAGRPLRVSLTLARWYAIPCGLCVPRARSGCPSGSPRVSFSCVCARALAVSAPPPAGWCGAHLAWSRHWALVGPFHLVRAPPRVLPRSRAPSGVLGGGRSGPGSPLLGLGLRGRRPLAARPLERAARVPRPACPGCGRCGRGISAPAPQLEPSRAGVARYGGGGRASPGGVLSTFVRGAWCQALSLPRPPVLWSGLPRFRDPCVPGAVDAGAWTQHRPPSVRPRGPALFAVGVAEGRPRGGCLPPLCGAPGVRRCPSPDRPSSGAGCQASATRVSRVRSMWACGPSTGPTACALAGRRCSLWGWRKGVPGGGAFHRCEGRLVSGAVPPPAARPLERAARVPRPVCPGCGRCGRVDPAPAPQRAPLRAGVARCGGGGRASPGGVPSTVVRGAWCQALSLPRPPVLWSGQPGFRNPCVPGAVDAGVWTLHRPHSVRPCGPALLAVGVAEGRARGGCLPLL